MTRTVETIRAAALLARPHSCAVGVAGSLGILAILGEARARALLAPAAVALMVAGANTLNDVYDLDIDRLNAPKRPLPSGTVTPRFAAGLGRAFMALAALAAAELGPACLATAACQIGVLWCYARWSKRLGLMKNVVFAAYCASALPFTALAAHAWDPRVPVLAACGFATMLALELFKDIADVDGDRALGARTLATLAGPQAARLAAFVVLLAAWPLALWPWYSGLAGMASFVGTNAAAVLCLMPFGRARIEPSSKVFVLAGTLAGLLGFIWG